MLVPFNNLQNLHTPLLSQLETASSRVLSSGNYILGKELESFEDEFSKALQLNHTIGVSNGLDAITLILKALAIGQGDEVIVPTHTFIATWLAVSHSGATLIPVPTDQYYCLDATKLKSYLNKHTKAIIGVHLYGHPFDKDAIQKVVDECGYSIPIIEDAAQAHGALYKNQPVGKIGLAAAFSFYPGKNLGALGDAGGISTHDAAFAEKIKSLRNYGSPQKYQHEVLGVNARLDELQAAFLRVKLPFLATWNKQKAEIADFYLDNLGSCQSIKLPIVASWAKPVWHQFVIEVDDRDALQKYLSLKGIQALIHYPTPNHRHRAYQDYFSNISYPEYEMLTQRILSLPICPTLTTQQTEYVITSILNFFNNKKLSTRKEVA